MGHSADSAGWTDSLAGQVIDTAEDPTLIADATGRIVFWNQAAATWYGVAAEDAIGRLAVELLGREWADEERMAEAAVELAAHGEWHVELAQVRADGRRVNVRGRVRALGEGASEGFVITLRDVTNSRELERERHLLAAAVEHAAESVVITDVQGSIEYVNPAFESVTGYRRDEVLGRNPRILKSGLQAQAFYRGMWNRLLAGQTFRGEFHNRRKDGSLYQEVATISPVLGADGVAHHYIAVKRDVTRQREFERRMDREARERASAMDALVAVRPGATAEATARDIAGALVASSGFDHVAILSFEADDQVVTLATAGASSGNDMPRLVPSAQSRGLVDRANAGPWVESGTALVSQHRAALAAEAIAHAPILFGGEAVGLMSVGIPSSSPDAAVGRLAFLVEVAALAAGLMGTSLAARRATATTRLQIRRVIEDRAFAPVFQPVADLESGTIVGYEALTRFEDGTPPDVVFATADRCGLGLELEEATMAAALEAALTLPANMHLHVNASPAFILDPDRLPRLLRGLGWNLTLEVTEQHQIDDYDAVRCALERVGPVVSLAVDDAGAGFASLRHILELRPSTVKLDRFLVTGIDRDPTRRALVAGMVHFAESTGFTLVAEGVETEAERSALLELGVRQGQGWLLGRPQRAPAPVPARASGPSPRDASAIAQRRAARTFSRAARRGVVAASSALLT